ncbi:hypothetical protein B0T26DRAFT_721172 [Lasiosphaeria miniovina]|uniref:Protein kinase domain-containing protein n=1 Tax=Lasiosphaeria miniovina TaxID=1954250 RepID=A0AA40A540_9PEZI|nr:uncharacterized protein B0T26DRAFT_721172 [Lasiosphaeria miniovina]KAK0709318.1 hypothetical protein B0T26DRAFT_721172 [Lasiosphaeria miniovina]
MATCLRSWKYNPGQCHRVVPRLPTEEKLFLLIAFGEDLASKAAFKLQWSEQLVNRLQSFEIQALLGSIARLLNSGVTAPADSTGNMCVYKGYRLCRNTFATVDQGPNLRTGALQAFRALRLPIATFEDVGAAGVTFEIEKDVSKKLSDDNIIPCLDLELDVRGDCRILWTYYPVYDGTVTDLVKDQKHDCLSPKAHGYHWYGDLVTCISSAEAYLKRQGITHHCIRLDNIFWNFVMRKGGRNIRKFVLGPGDYGLADDLASRARQAPKKDKHNYHFAPEVALHGKIDQRSEMLSVGILFGEVLGYWCAAEYANLTTSDVITKSGNLNSMKYRENTTIKDGLGNNTPGWETTPR